MNNPATILSFLGSVAVVLIIAVLYFLAPSPKPPILRILLIFFTAAAVLGVLAGIIVPLVINKKITKMSDREISSNNQIVTQSPIFGFKATAAFGGEYGQKQEELIKLLKDIGFQFLEFKVRWNEIEPTNDNFQIADLQKFTEELNKNDIQPILMIKTGATEWAVDRTNKKGGQCEKIADLDHPDREYSFAPKSIDEYQEYIKTLVSNLNVKYYLIENEAGSCGFFYGNAEDYTAMLKIAFTTIHKECADCKVGISNIGLGPKQKQKTQKAAGKFWLDNILTLGGEKYFDFYSNHCNAGEGKYESADLRDRENLSLCGLDQLKAEFTELKTLNKELIITESGVLPKDELEERIKRNLYAIYYGQTTMVGSLNIEDLQSNIDIKNNWRFLINLFSNIEKIENFGQEGQYEYFKVYRRDKKSIGVLWIDDGQITVNLADRNFRQFDPDQPAKTISGQNIVLTSKPLILEAD